MPMEFPKTSSLPYPEIAQVARRAAAEGIVLLENKNSLLPLKDKTVALFGAGAYHTIKGGTGSGNVSNPYEVNIYQGLLNAGFTVTSAAWVEAYGQKYEAAQTADTTLTPLDRFWSGLRIFVEEDLLTAADCAAAPAETAVYVVRRNAGEGEDRKVEAGDYLLTETELANLCTLASHYAHVAVILNTGIMDTGFFGEIPGLEALLFVSQPGMEGGNAVADVLCGKVSPSGRLADTWPAHYADCPANEAFGCNLGEEAALQVDYTEGVYVGYRYFDSFNIAPAYAFGYGLSYTDFSINVEAVAADWSGVELRVKVTNIGAKHAARQVVQVYASAPQTGLDKPWQQLVAFGKTGLLAPGQSETLTLHAPMVNFTSYHEGSSARILEAGEHILRVGENSRATHVAARLRLDENAVVEQLSRRLPCDRVFAVKNCEGMPHYTYEAEAAELRSAPVLPLQATACPRVDHASKIDSTVSTTYLVEGSEYHSGYRPGAADDLRSHTEKFCTVPAFPCAKLYDVYTGTLTMEQFVAQLDLETLATLALGAQSQSKAGQASERPIEGAQCCERIGSGQSTPNLVNSYGVPCATMADGPAGLHFPGKGSTAWPAGTLLAQTWDEALLQEVGQCLGREMAAYGATILLGPGMNIHRDPLCGRNFEYFSEDPLLTGKMAAAWVRGVQSQPGYGVSLKHFACNNQETHRLDGNASVTERALREIYLRGFEIAVRESCPMTVMSSYNLLNGVHTSSQTDLITHILRGEWGFRGFVMTDWGTQSDAAQDVAAGNDINMAGDKGLGSLVNAVLGCAPQFDPDGGVTVVRVPLYNGMMHRDEPQWNSFVPGKNGPDPVQTHVAAGTPVGEAALKAQAEGLAAVTQNADGSHTVTYQGRNKASYLTVGDLQACAGRLLAVLLQTWAVNGIYNEATGYEPIALKPYQG